MAVPFVQSSTTYNATSVASIVNTKPTGLAVGDYMVHYCWYIEGTVTSYTTPTGWTKLGEIDSANGGRKYAVFAKVADSSDVAATDFTVNIGKTVDAVNGILLRIDGVGRFDSIELDAADVSSTVISFTGSSTPVAADSLLLVSFAYRSGSGLTTISGYTTTPSYTVTEIADIVTDSGAEDPGLAVAYAEPSSLDEITAYAGTLSSTKQYHVGSLILLSPIVNETGTNALLEVSPTTFTQSGSSGTLGTNALLEVSPTQFDQSGRGDVMLVYTNRAKPSTPWTNPNK